MSKEDVEQLVFLDNFYCIGEDARKVWKILREKGVTEREIMNFVIAMNAYYRFKDTVLQDEIINLSNQIGSFLYQLKIRGEMGKK
jgi:anthranilate phosphoribosyltransferase